MTLTRLTAAAGAAALLTAALYGTSAAADPDRRAPHPRSTDQPLRVLAERHDLGVGTAIDMAALSNDATYREVAAREFNSVTAENVMKWESLEPQRGVYNWGPADRLVEFAEKNGQTVRGHVLVWHNQNPSWLVNGNFTTEELREILRNHITTVVSRYKGKVWQWDVANEVIGDDGQLRNTFWLQKLGPGYIADAFRWAHEADPKALLFINDYNVEDINAKSTAYYELVKQLLADGVPIHGFGAQGHHTVSYAPRTMAQNLQRFHDLGLYTAVTEVDVRMQMPADSIKLLAQAHVYSTMLEACLATPTCLSYTVWGFTDKYSWVPGWFQGQGAANIFTETYQPKPAYRALQTDLALTDGPRHRD